MLKYLKKAFAVPWNMLAFFGAMGFAALSGQPDIAIPLVLAGEAAYVGFLGAHPKFQAYVDAQEAKVTREAGAEQSGEVFQRMLKTLPESSRRRYAELLHSCRQLRQIAADPKHSGSTGVGESLDSLLPEAFAVVREAARRVIGLRHYDEQLIGGMVLHMGRIAEMRTGEGKTLVGTLPVYLNALEGKGVHVVTVNDYLARRDSAWMGRIYNFLGMSVGVVYPGMDHADKRAAYAADITYGTNNEFGFDYLRDNMAQSKDQRYQRALNYAIVDEGD